MTTKHKTKNLTPIPDERILGKIYFIRGKKVHPVKSDEIGAKQFHGVNVDDDLALLYGVPTKVLNQAVQRNKKRFPEDFMFRLTLEETRIFESLRSQSVTLDKGSMRSQFATLEESKIKSSRSQIVTLNSNLRSQFAISKEGTMRSQIVTASKRNVRFRPYVFTEQGVAMLSSVLKSDRAIQVNIQIMRTFTKLREMLLTHRELREKVEKMEQKYDRRFKVIFDVMKRLLDVKKKSGSSIGFTPGAERSGRKGKLIR